MRRSSFDLVTGRYRRTGYKMKKFNIFDILLFEYRFQRFYCIFFLFVFPVLAPFVSCDRDSWNSPTLILHIAYVFT